MSLAFRVITPGLFTTLQDLGRIGFGSSGVPRSGAMDPYSFRLANIMLGNTQNCAALEMTFLGPELEFCGDLSFAIAGGDLGARLNGIELPPFGAWRARQGDLLSFKGGKGVRAYLAVPSGFQAPLVMGSRSTYFKANLGGFKGLPLQKGACLETVDRANSLFSWQGELPLWGYPNLTSLDAEIRVILGPQKDYFSDEQIQCFLSEEWAVSKDFDRMGYRLEGSPIKHIAAQEIISDGIISGAIQIPGHGLPIILLADAQTTGGYPKIATIISADLGFLAHRQRGDKIKFRQVDFLTAQEALIILENNLARIEDTLKNLKKSTGRLFQLTLGGEIYKIRAEEKSGENLGEKLELK